MINHPICGTALVTLATQQFETIVTFYQALFGARPQVLRPGVYAEFRVSGLTLGIFQPRENHAAEFQPARPGPMSLCLEVMDLTGAIAHLTALGYPPPGEPMTASHGQEIYTYDPDGNRLILHQG